VIVVAVGIDDFVSAHGLYLLYGPAQLVGATGGLAGTTDAVEFLFHDIHFHTCDKMADTLKVAVAASDEVNARNNVIVIDSQLYILAACPHCFIKHLIHYFFKL
jgi:hypothetical protein